MLICTAGGHLVTYIPSLIGSSANSANRNIMMVFVRKKYYALAFCSSSVGVSEQILLSIVFAENRSVYISISVTVDRRQ